MSGYKRMLHVIREQGDFVCELIKTGRTDISNESFEYERAHAWLLYTLLQTFDATNDRSYLDCAAMIMDDVLEWWKTPQDHQETISSSNEVLAFHEQSNREDGTGYWIPNRRMANCGHSSSSTHTGRFSSPWMGAILETAVIQWYETIKNHFGGAYTFTDLSETNNPVKTIVNDIPDVDGIVDPDVKEMINQTLHHLITYGWVDKVLYERDPDLGYPWLREWAQDEDYDRPKFVYSPCSKKRKR